MKLNIAAFVIIALLPALCPSLAAKDFGWMDDLNISAQADPAGFHARLATRFKIGDAEISTVVSNCEKPADAYMVLRCGELSGRPVDEVLAQYKESKGKGWGVIAKRLGIKRGSKEFKALKNGHDLAAADETAGAGKGKDGTAKGKDAEKEPGKGAQASESEDGKESGKGGAPKQDQDTGHGKGRGRGGR